MSTVGPAIAAILDDYSRLLVEALQLGSPFQQTPQKPGLQFGMFHVNRWTTPNPDYEDTTIAGTCWVVNSAGSYYDCSQGQVLLLAALDDFLPQIKKRVDRRRVLKDFTYTAQITPTIRPPVNHQTNGGELYVGDIICPVVFQLAIARNMVGGHL
ncbi:hypothetical protein [Stenomitos frigidus]|uniref:Uncharacterized protein n=1 Tax=Stenomitos frigidus ULC18 TaxID=2107698 RepID=A0A2T1E0A6_9CYAN|nr:hypothetical protein [Stenomitos frigidus]PSB26188.1 hypothetical protein C7B82_20425 [Stenomitos frigidus ULC18]